MLHPLLHLHLALPKQPDPITAIFYVAFFIGLTLLTVRRPIAGLCVLIAVQPFALYQDVGHTMITLPKAALIAVLLGVWTHRGSFAPLFAPAPRRILIAAGFVFAATMLTYAHATYHTPVIRESFKALEYILLFATAVAAYRLDPNPRPLRTTIYVTALVVCVLALAQEIVGAPSAFLLNGHATPRIAGPLEGPNQLAGYFDILLPLVLALAIDQPCRLARIALFFILWTDVLTYSRAGAMGAAAGTLAIAWIYRGRIIPLIAPAVAGIAAGASVEIFWGVIAHTLSTHTIAITRALGVFRLSQPPEPTGGVGTRAELWHAAAVLWLRHPFFGIGAGNFELEIPLTGLQGVRTHANSLYLQSLVEGGIPLLCATLWLVYTSIATFARDRLSSPFVAAAFAGSIALALHQIVDFLTFYPKVGGMWWLALALGAAQLAVTARVRTADVACAEG